MDTLIKIIKEKVLQYHDDVVDHYKYLHQHPELSFEEKNTASFVTAQLDSMNIMYRKNIGGFGILAWIKESYVDLDY